MNETAKDTLKQAALVVGIVGVITLMKRRTDAIVDRSKKAVERERLVRQHIMWAAIIGPELTEEEFEQESLERLEFIKIVTK